MVVEDYADASDGIASFGEFGVQNALAAPVRVDSRVVGSLTVASFEPGRRYGTVEQEILSALAEHAGLALLDASLIDRRERLAERQGEERFQALIRHASDLIAIVDPEGSISFATPSVGRVLGVTPEALRGSSLLAHIHPADRPRAAVLLGAAAGRQGTLPPADLRLVPAGSQFQPRRWMHVEVLATNLLEHPHVQGIVINARDVTERVLAEERRRLQDARYRQIVDTTHDGVWMTDPDDRAVFVNDALARMLGRTPDELIGRRPGEFMPADQAAIVREAMARRRRGVHDRYEVTLLRADGTPLHMAISGTPIFEDERFAGALALCGDITELVAARAAKEQLESRLQQAQELEMLGRLAGHVAHDFNQVLAVILGYTRLLSDRTSDAATGADLGRITEAAEHGAALARQLVMFSRRDEGEPEILDLSAATLATARLVAGTVPAGVQVETAVGDDPLPVCIDPTKLRQILMNLIDNAVDALAGGGRLVLSTRALAVDGTDEAHAALTPGPYAALTVADTGHGMPTDVMARALEPAFTTKPAGTGTGLGLAIVHGAIRAAGGHVGLRSRPGHGTTVEIVLPLAPAHASAAAATGSADPAPEVPPAAEATILLVEDDASVLDLTTRILAERGYDVVAVPSAEAAVAAASERDIDLLVTDQALPGASGLELVGGLAGLAPGTPAIVMSGYVSELTGNDRAGVVWLQKPFGASALLDAVRASLATTSPGRSPSCGDAAS